METVVEELHFVRSQLREHEKGGGLLILTSKVVGEVRQDGGEFDECQEVVPALD